MHRNRVALIALVTAGFTAAGCGSEKEPSSDSQPEAAQVETAAPKREPKPKSARARMVECIEGAGYKVTAEDDPNNLTVNSPNGTLEAVAIIHPTPAKGDSSAAQGRDEDGLNAVAYGRAELILHAAKGAEARVIASCVADEYDD